MGNALKKIVARVKQLRKKHPNAKYKSLQKQAGREFKAGKLKTKRKKVGAVKKTVRRKKRAAAKPKVITRTRTIVKVVRAKRRKYAGKKIRVKSYKATRYRRVGAAGSSALPWLVGGAVVLGAAYLLLKKPAATQYVPTGNPVRDNSASSILSWAAAGSMGLTAITSLINALNNSSDADVVAAGNTVKSGGTIDINTLRPSAGSISW